MIAVEIDGGTWVGGRHTTGRGHRTDSEKSNLATILGWRMLRFDASAVHDGTALEVLEQLMAGGASVTKAQVMGAGLPRPASENRDPPRQLSRSLKVSRNSVGGFRGN